MKALRLFIAIVMLVVAATIVQKTSFVKEAVAYVKPVIRAAFANPVYLPKTSTVRVSFARLEDVKFVDYTLVYGYGTGDNELLDGVHGSFVPTKNTVSKDLFMGTCSAKSCLAKPNIHDVKFYVQFTYKDGFVATKGYRLTK